MEKSEAPPDAGASSGKPQLWLGPPLVLASGSAGRSALLKSAGFDFDVDPARIDERAVGEEFLRTGGAPSGLAAHLAKAKALEVSARNPGALCLGADQTLTLDGRILHKPSDIGAAADHLRRLAGRRHRLDSGFCFARRGASLFEGGDAAVLTMRALDERAIDLYLALAGEAALCCVGAYQVEGLGAHLFERIDGDQTTILGLPMPPLLSWLRSKGYLAL